MAARADPVNGLARVIYAMSAAVSEEGQQAERIEHAYRAVLRYDGRNYYGWQRLRDKPTLQEAVESAVEGAFGQRVAVAAAGRTDRGAHAEGQVISFRLSKHLPAEELADVLAQHLADDIQLIEADNVPLTFHARSSAVAKIYQYRIVSSPKVSPQQEGRVWHLPKRLDVEKMQQAARRLLGQQDFASFATKSRFAKGSTLRDLQEASVNQSDDALVLQFRANSFLYHMVRNMVRALAKVGEGRFSPERISEILAAKDRAASPGSAPASGLYLMRVIY